MQARMEARGLFAGGARWLAAGALLITLTQGAIAQVAGGDDYIYLKHPVFRIPVSVAPDRLRQIKELRLFVSTDLGASWTMVRSVEPTQKSFTFRAQADGEYWFLLAQVDAKGNVDPKDVRGMPADMKIIVDTKAPTIELKALPRDDGRVGVTWKLKDEKLDLSSLKIESRGARDLDWHEVRADKMREGQVDWPAVSTEEYSARLTVRDRAGNESIARIEIGKRADAPGPLASNRDEGASLRRLDIDDPGYSVPPPPSMGSTIPRAAPKSALPVPTASAPAVAAVPTTHSVHRPVFDRSRPDLPAEAAAAPIQQVQGNPTALAFAEGPRQSIATTRPAGSAHEAPTAPAAPAPKLPWLVGTPKFSIDYSMKGVGPAGVKKVELFLTRDNGQTWKLHAEDPDRQPPFDVELPEEGRYGLKIVVVSPSGWQREPKPGEAPQLVVQLDTTPPDAELYQLLPDPASSTDSMLIRWTSKDKHLAAGPVNLYFAEKPEGPWYAIKTGLPATGSYSWKIPQGIPYEVYLRLDARDMANNVSRAVTPEPVTVDLSRPEAEVIAILPDGNYTR